MCLELTRRLNGPIQGVEKIIKSNDIPLEKYPLTDLTTACQRTGSDVGDEPLVTAHDWQHTDCVTTRSC